ncbi:MAG TPA: hypothetical protein VK174_13185, partial [Chitinophagales bacterium]|nr:hypothetical protein [Chitinophagales bacterium]
MKGSFTFLFLLLFQCWLCAQDYLQGSLKVDAATPQPILYDRTQPAPAKGIYKSVYKVLNESKDLLYQLTLVHDKPRAFLTLTVKPVSANPRTMTFKYDTKETGLIMCDTNNLDTMFTMAKKCLFLVSFTDTLREYPVLHKINASDKIEILLDPLTALRIKKHNELFRTVILKDAAVRKRFNELQRKSDDENTSLKDYLLPLRESILARSQTMVDSMLLIRAQLMQDSADAFTDKKSATAEVKYKGERKKGEPEGEGLMAKNGNIYKGLFRSGQFISGVQLVRTTEFEYCGGFSNLDLQGAGYLQYADSGYQVGSFVHGKLLTGISSRKEKSGEFYFGEIQNKQQTGYGEMMTKASDRYCGVFNNGRLVKGFV